MIYIIDANNLAGKLEILFQEGFDKKLLEIIKAYFQGKQIEVKLVFDSAEVMGDKFKDENIEVVYTPRDSFYDSADDKVLELAKNAIDAGVGNNQITVVTDDIDLREKLQVAMRKRDYKLNLMRSTDFAEKINIKKGEEARDEDDRGLNVEEENKINKELLSLWQ